MKPSKRTLVLFLAVLFAALLALPIFSGISMRTTKAGVQELGKHDNRAKDRRAGPPQGPTGTAPANDNCANAILVASCPFTHTVDTSGASDEAGEPQSTCTLQANSVWYTFTNSSANITEVTVQTCNNQGFDTAVMVWRPDGAACDFANFTPIACNDDACGDGFQSTITFLADPGVSYKIQVGGFAGETGSLTVDIDCVEIVCPIITVNGTLGSGSPDHPSVTGLQTPNRLFRDGVPSTCAVPKVCPGPFSSGSFNYDAYTFTNETPDPQCVTVFYDPNTGANPGGVNIHAVAYLGTYQEVICTNYLADVGSSDTLPFSFTVPGGADFVVVIVANNPGVGVGSTYQFRVQGNICEQFDFCVQHDSNPGRFIQFNSTSGNYRFTDCSKGVILEGTGVVSQFFCKIQLFDQGPNPRRPDRSVSLLVNPCTGRGDAAVRTTRTGPLNTIGDSNVFNNTCECPNGPL
jgi:hypothetical protein